MPLKAGSDQKTISSNISELTHHGSRPRSHEQIVAIALHNADKSNSSMAKAYKEKKEKQSYNRMINK